MYGRYNRKKSGGFTLVELVVSMALTAILATAVASIMFPVVSIFMDMQKLSRAQMVADMVTDALRKECAAAYVTGVADVKVLNVSAASDHTTGDNMIMDQLTDTGIRSVSPGNTLVFRINEGYAKALYWNTWISASDVEDVRNNDAAEGAKMGTVTSRAAYRLMPYEKKATYTAATMPLETRPGYLHSAYYTTKAVAVSQENEKQVSDFRIDKVYDYTNPFPANAYNGFTVKVEYAAPIYQTVVTGSAMPADQRPVCVVATISVYDGDFAEQNDPDRLVYSREAVVCFAEDNRKATE
ncbi:MAG: type II secretion system GspH family protein [Lachnospiraceae bacterium]|nr:type II secretion system GspH family protein [Lachnospiraceae bacterium]